MFNSPLSLSLQQSTLAELRKRLIQIITAFALAVIGVMMGAATLPATESFPLGGAVDLRLGALAVVALGGVLLLVWINRLQAAALFLLIILVSSTVVTRVTGGEILEGFAEVFLLLALLAVGTLRLDRRVYWLAHIILLGTLLAGALGEVQEAGTLLALNPIHDLVLIPVFGLIGLAVGYFADSLYGALDRSERNTSLIQASADIGQITAQSLELNVLLNEVIDTICKRYDFYHAQVFLLNDTRDQAVLAASTGEVGRQLLANQHRLAVGSQSVIGQVTLRGEPVIVNDTNRSGGYHARNELLPNTRSELAIPLMDGGVIIGALDVQSARANAFDQDDVRAMRLSANLLAASIRNVRLFEEQRAAVLENRRLIDEADANLKQVEELSRQITERTWQMYLTEPKPVTGVTLDQKMLRPDSSWSPELIEASRRRSSATHLPNGKRLVAVPIILRGAVIGAVEVELDASVSEVDVEEMLDAITQRLAVSLENARLFEESQEDALNEQRINEIVSNYQQTNSIDELLRITLQQLSQSLGAERGAIRLGKMEGNGHA